DPVGVLRPRRGRRRVLRRLEPARVRARVDGARRRHLPRGLSFLGGLRPPDAGPLGALPMILASVAPSARLGRSLRVARAPRRAARARARAARARSVGPDFGRPRPPPIRDRFFRTVLELAAARGRAAWVPDTLPARMSRELD